MNTYCTVIVLSLISLTGATQSEIVGGKNAKPHSRPYMASLQSYGDHTCGGFLIREDFVLTAAHCKNNLPRTVVLGAHNIHGNESSQQQIPVDKYFQHPNYINGKRQYDIMLLKLKQKAKLNKNVKPIDLPKKDKNILDSIKCSVACWGKTKPTKNSPASDVLKEAEETILSNSECNKTWKKYFNESHMICTKFTKKGGGVCQGDSGGPLVCKKKPVGIVAYSGDNCSDPKYPHVYTKISSFLSWIENVMKKQGNVA